MPVVKVHRYKREDARNNPDSLYLFGDNDMREGYGGQAAEMRDEENAVGIRTKWAPHTTFDAYFSDDEFAEVTAMIDADLEPVREHLEKGKIVVIPADGLGTGLSRLPEMAPQIYDYLLDRLIELEKI
jgi:hypothetical protein